MTTAESDDGGGGRERGERPGRPGADKANHAEYHRTRTAAADADVVDVGCRRRRILPTRQP